VGGVLLCEWDADCGWKEVEEADGVMRWLDFRMNVSCHGKSDGQRGIANR